MFLAACLVALMLFGALVFTGVVLGFQQYNVVHEPALIKGCRWKGSCKVVWTRVYGTHVWLVKHK